MANSLRQEPLLTVQHVGVSFAIENPTAQQRRENKTRKVILDDVSFIIHNIVREGMTQGQIVSLIGRSGIGKSQLLKCMAGLMKPTAGSILINQEQVGCEPGDMGLVPQNYYMFPWRRIRKILEMAAAKNPNLKDAAVRKEAVDSYIAAFELSDHVNKFPSQLSGGQKQRVSISQQLLNGSNFLLMDEPFSGLDSLMIKKTTSLLSRIAASDELKTIILVSHDLSNSVAISDTVYILSKQGRTDEQGATLAKEICLVDRGLAWQPDIKRMPEFRDTLDEIETLL